MDPEISTSESTSKINEDAEMDGAVDKLCKGVWDYIFLPSRCAYHMAEEAYIINKSRLDRQEGSWSSPSRFLAFSEKYKSKFKEFMEWYSRDGVYPIKDVLPVPDPDAFLYDDDDDAVPVVVDDDEDVLEKYGNFKRFDIVTDYTDHLFATSPMEKASVFSAERIQNERRMLEEQLPETIFVRAYKHRMDILRAVIIGPKGTPYHDGLFFFDVYFPQDYPARPPDHVLNADPLFHQPGFLEPGSGPSMVAEYFSLLYNEDVLIKSLKIMIHIMNNQPKNFEAFVVGHFRNRALDILKACKAYMDGLQVGCIVGNKDSCCSKEFPNDVASCIPDLIYHLKKIGATEADSFIPQSAPTADDGSDEDLNDGAFGGKRPSMLVSIKSDDSMYLCLTDYCFCFDFWGSKMKLPDPDSSK
ncbi:hypothetical protein SSX86_005405 [Deinandra increscens subsp. villosa]|uniref:UBC core domain-containing protein n=1 Tax=Deinandra increscens subsp. villosa TaxID=3103831 RepID=A0AAP0HBU8_9ASTR